jgi:hypothetical protein
MSTLLLAVFSFLTLPSQATSFYIRPFSEFTQSAANIVHARLSNIHTENALTADGGKTIYTYANAEVIEVIKGAISAPNILIRKVGGTKDGVTLEIPSNVEFSENEEGVFFLSPQREDHAYEMNGMELGKFGLKDENGEKILTGGIFNYARGRPSDEAKLAPNQNENLRPWSIKQLKELVKKQESEPPPVTITQANGPAANHVSSTSQSLPSDTVGAPVSQANDIKPEIDSTSPFPIKWLILAAVILLALAFFYRKK